MLNIPFSISNKAHGPCHSVQGIPYACHPYLPIWSCSDRDYKSLLIKCYFKYNVICCFMLRIFGESSKSLLTCYCVNICYFPLKGSLSSAVFPWLIRLLISLKSLKQRAPILFSWTILCFLLRSNKTKLKYKIYFF